MIDLTTNRQAFLDMLAACEGTDTDEGYRALFGYTPSNHRVFDNGYIDHPNIKFPFTQTDGAQNYSTAAGRYQIINSSWREGKAKWGLLDFAPRSQDEWALRTIEAAGALPDVDAGNLQSAIDKCAGIWASLPASHYPQPKRTYQFSQAAYLAAGGMLA